MNPPVSAVLKLSQMSIPDKITKGIFINQQWALYGATFPATAPNTPSDRDKATNILSTAHAKAQDGSKLARAEEKAAEATFDAYFGAYRDWANQPDVAQGDEIKIAQLGLDLSRQEGRRTLPLPTPDMLPLTGTNEGELIAACTSIPDARAYVFFIAYGDEMPADSDYQYCTSSTRPKVTLTLEAGKMAWVRVLAIGTQGPSARSAAQKRRVL